MANDPELMRGLKGFLSLFNTMAKGGAEENSEPTTAFTFSSPNSSRERK